MATLKNENAMRQQALRDRMMEILGITAGQYYQIQFDTAETFMMERTINDQEVVSEFLREPAFWSWWRNQYMLVDEYFGLLHETGSLTGNPLQMYHQLHARLNCYPDAVLWRKIEDSYMQTVSKIVKSKTI